MIEAVTVCDNYSDFLAHTLPTNRHCFDRMVVVTSPEDRKTRRLCEHWQVECVPTDRIGSRWGSFAKGCAINDGLAKLKLTDWVVHLDADIVLPPHTRQVLEREHLNPQCIYGVDRYMVSGFAAWQGFNGDPAVQLEDSTWVHLSAFPMGVRYNNFDHGGYVPIGFFQLWNAGATGIRRYPEAHDGANRTDSQFAEQWDRSRRALIPEIVVYHLDSEASEMGRNWSGRKTRPFCGQY